MATWSLATSKQVAALRIEMGRVNERLARAEQALAQRRPARRLGRGGRWLGAVLLALLLATLPLALVAANPFDDLTPGSAHNGDIDLIYNAGITKGCVPNRRFCPNANVTNEQLATYLARTAGLGNHPPVANAYTLQGLQVNDFVLASEETRFDYSFLGAVPLPVFSTGPIITHFAGPATVVERPSNAQSFIVLLPLAVPTKLFGEGWAVTSLEVCYKAEGTAYIDHTELKQGRLGEDSAIASSATDRRSSTPACYTVTPGAPVPLTAATFLQLLMQSADTDDSIVLYSAQLRLAPLD